MNEKEIQKHNELIKRTYKQMATFIPEKTIIEFLINMTNDENIKKSIEKIGDASDIDSDYKNEIFDEIFIDENGFILDVRIYYVRPSDEEIINMAEYWLILEKTFNRKVQPVFIVSGE